MKPEWTDPVPRSIDLGDEEPDIFHRYVQWLYSHNVHVVRCPAPYKSACFDNFAHAYLLGEKLMDPTYQNAVLRAWTDCIKEEEASPGDETMRIMYEGTTKISPGRKLMVDIWVEEANGDWGIQDVDGRIGRNLPTMSS
jgi:hypothetical protein